ncbi:unnamed protein product [Bursaphelenchus okinawaensis]|uniref:Glutathione transferase n=1 Tax=Bursaphelenchus okinawaensis TaxID=465554 RepID=A0A811KC73_9BILA|nr:unnamed protein product [Bursaphelenchus okinawaensis]CAG9101458.1 unnamed protein product [Bursaphelenchus okinawaensis]
MFTYANIPFKDTRVSFQEWGKIRKDKTRFPYGQMPILMIGDTLIAQSHAIIRYVAAEANLAGRNKVEAAEIGQLYELCHELFEPLIPYLRVTLGIWRGDKKKMYKEVVVPNVQKYAPLIEDHIGANGYVHKSGISYVDFYLADNVMAFQNYHPDLFDSYPNILALKEKFLQMPELKEYFESVFDPVKNRSKL